MDLISQPIYAVGKASRVGGNVAINPPILHRPAVVNYNNRQWLFANVYIYQGINSLLT